MEVVEYIRVNKMVIAAKKITQEISCLLGLVYMYVDSGLTFADSDSRTHTLSSSLPVPLGLTGYRTRNNIGKGLKT